MFLQKTISLLIGIFLLAFASAVSAQTMIENHSSEIFLVWDINQTRITETVEPWQNTVITKYSIRESNPDQEPLLWIRLGENGPIVAAATSRESKIELWRGLTKQEKTPYTLVIYHHPSEATNGGSMVFDQGIESVPSVPSEIATQISSVPFDQDGFIRIINLFGDPSLIKSLLDLEKLEQVFPWDVNRDGTVNIFDLILVFRAFGPTEGGTEDVDKNGIVDILDLTMVATNLGQSTTLGAPALTKIKGALEQLRDHGTPEAILVLELLKKTTPLSNKMVTQWAKFKTRQ
jgi:hypothetical protein